MQLFGAELSQAVLAPSNALAAEIRLTWWREEVERLRLGVAVPGHPTLRALQGLSDAALRSLEEATEARICDVDEAPFKDEAALAAYLDAADGGLLRAAVAALGEEAAGVDLLATGQAIGFRRLWLEADAWAKAGRSFIPKAAGADADLDALRAFASKGVQDRLPAARAEVRATPARRLPAVATAAVLPAAAKGRVLGDLSCRLRVLQCALTGRL